MKLATEGLSELCDLRASAVKRSVALKAFN